MDVHITSEAEADHHAWFEEDKFMGMVEDITKSVGPSCVSNEPLYDLSVLFLLLEIAPLRTFEHLSR